MKCEYADHLPGKQIIEIGKGLFEIGERLFKSENPFLKKKSENKGELENSKNMARVSSKTLCLRNVRHGIKHKCYFPTQVSL